MIYQKLMGVSGASTDVYSFNLTHYTNAIAENTGSGVFTAEYTNGFYVVHPGQYLDGTGQYGLSVAKYDSNYDLAWINFYRTSTGFASFYDWYVKSVAVKRYYNGSSYEDDALYILGDNQELGGFIIRIDADGTAGDLYSDTDVETFYDCSVGGSDTLYVIGKMSANNNMVVMGLSAADSINVQKEITNSDAIVSACICTDSYDDADAHFAYSTTNNSFLVSMEMGVTGTVIHDETFFKSGSNFPTITDIISTTDPNSFYESRVLFAGYNQGGSEVYLRYYGYTSASGYQSGNSVVYTGSKDVLKLAYDETNTEGYLLEGSSTTGSYTVSKFDFDVTNGTAPSREFTRASALAPSSYQKGTGNLTYLTVQSSLPSVVYGQSYFDVSYFTLLKTVTPSTGTFDSGYNDGVDDLELTISVSTPTASSLTISTSATSLTVGSGSVTLTTDGNFFKSDISTELTEYIVPIDT